MTPEGAVKQDIRNILTQAGAYHAVIHQSGFGVAGIPDILACYRGRFLGIEVKAPGRKGTALQLRQLELINGAGGLGLIADDPDKVRELLTWLDHQRRGP